MKKQRKPEEKENSGRLLRNAAEEKPVRSSGTSSDLKERTSEEFLQELRVHQIELEMQNEELRKAQLALEESRQRYADLYDFAPVGYFTFTSEALIKEANLTAAALLGITRQKLINVRFRRMVAAKDQDRWDQHFLKVLQQGERQTCELMLKRQDGSTFYAGLESIRKEVSSGAPEIHTAITDITERKRAEEALRKSEEMFSNLFDNAAGGVFQTTLEGRVVIVNRVFTRMFGYESSEEVINTITDITRQIYANPDDRQMISGFLKEKGYLRNYECPMRRKDGSLFWGSISARFSETVDGLPCFEGLIVDVSERKRAEEELSKREKKYRELYDFLPIPVYEMDLEANLISVNRAVYETFRGTEEDLKKDFRAWQLLSPEDIEKSAKNIQRLLKGEQVEGTEYTLMRLDGSVFPAIVISSVIYSDGNPVGLRGAIVDISERKQTEDALKESEELFKSYLEHAPDGVYMSDLEGTFLYGNRKCEEVIGYRREELIGKNFLELNILSEKSLNKAVQLLQANTEGRGTGPDEIELINKEGRLIPVEINTNVVQRMGQSIVIASVRDITERKRTEEELRESEEKYRNILENIEDGYFEIDPAGNFTFFNPSLCRIVGYPREEILGMNNRVFMDAENAKKVFRTFNEAYVTGIPTKGFEWETIRKDGTRVNIEVSLSIIVRPGEKPTGFRGIARDVTERKRAEKALEDSEKKYRLLVENAGEAIYVAQDGRLKFVNETSSKLTGYTREEMTSRPLIEFIHPDDRDLVLDRRFKRQEGRELPSIYSLRIITQSGDTRWVNLSAVQIEWEGKPATLNFMVDITGLKQAEESLRLSNEKTSKAFRTSPDWMTITTLEEGRHVDVNDAFVELSGFSREEALGKTRIELGLWVDPHERDRAMEIIRKEGCLKNYESKIRIKSGEVRTMLRSAEVFELEGQKYVTSTNRDITNLRKSQEKLEKTLESLRKAMGGIIQVISATVETRDPYTAGHQQRVADLARAIAQEMGLAEDQRDGLRMAGIIHDLGKVSLPAEILSKPTKLTEIEYQLIQAHSQIGYDILKGIEFPWPIADMVLQHHERMNGSGYPQGLKGEDILLEARILMVADVVEAIASNRPYRPALGIDAALEEIEKNKGILYDPEVAEVCLGLFREKGFRFG